MAEISEAAKIPFRTYQSIDMGERWPRVDNLEAIAGALGVPVPRLFRDSSAELSPKEAWALVGKALENKPEPLPIPEPLTTDHRVIGIIKRLKKRPLLIDTILTVLGPSTEDETDVDPTL